MSREHELFERLTTHRLALRQARNEMEDAKQQLAGRREIYRRVQADIEEVLEEIETGRSARPVLDAIERNGHPKPEPLPPDPRQEMLDDHRRYQVEMESGPGAPDPDAPTEHWRVYRYSESAPGHLGSPVGSQVAGTRDEAEKLAAKGWSGRLVIGEPFPHGFDCGCPVATRPDGKVERLDAERLTKALPKTSARKARQQRARRPAQAKP